MAKITTLIDANGTRLTIEKRPLDVLITIELKSGSQGLFYAKNEDMSELINTFCAYYDDPDTEGASQMPSDKDIVDVEQARGLSWSKYYKYAREYAVSQYGLRRVPVDRWKEHWATGIPFTHAARIENERKNPRF